MKSRLKLKLLNILILDDDPNVRNLILDALAEDGHKVTVCGSVKEFHRKTSDEAFDMYLMDLRLPDGNGLDLVQAVRSTSRGGILIISGSGDELDAVLGLELGADDYIMKPFRLRELRARVKSVARRTADRAAITPVSVPRKSIDIQSVHGLLVNARARSIQRADGEEIDLTTLEFDLFAALLSHPNVVLSRDRLMDILRGPGWAAYDRNIDGLISRLRHKLFPSDTGARIIKTIRGVGYMLSVD